ncbi:MAG: lipopolysaccharide biosynthesis protein [Paludibacteraceae bacterium]|nr:lipopolysaccharide biosynthesis protein [Paludibacteraceae bacterium]
MQENSSHTKKVFLSGVFYSALAKYSSLLVNIVITAILSRLFEPKDFGVVAIATMFLTFFSNLVTVGISPAIIQNKELEEEDYRGINSVVWILALVLSFLFYLFVPVIESYFEYGEDFRNILYLLCFCIFFSVATIVPNALLMKDKKFKVVTVRTIIVNVSTGILAVFYALNGGGVYALLVNPILGNFLILIINYICRPVSFSLKFSFFNKILSFATLQMVFNLIYLLYREIDKFCIGNILGPDKLGYYEKSYNVMLMPLTNVSAVLSPVLHPVLSDYQNNREYICNAYLRMLRLLSEVGFVISFLFYAFSDVLILTLYGDQWVPSIPVFQMLSLSIAFQLMQSPIGAVMQSINRLEALIYGSLIVLLSLVVCIGIGLSTKSLEITALMITVSYVIGYWGYNYFVCKYLEISVSEILRIIVKPLSIFVAVIVQLSIAKYFLECGSLELFACNIVIVVINSLFLYFTHSLPEAEKLCRKGLSKLNKNKN